MCIRDRTIDVAPPVVVALTARLLRAHIRGRPTHDARRRRGVPRCFHERARDAEVGEASLAARKENVLRLHVAMHQSLCVRRTECAGHGSTYCDHIGPVSYTHLTLPTSDLV